MLKTFRILIFEFVWRLDFGIWNLANELATPSARNDSGGCHCAMKSPYSPGMTIRRTALQASSLCLRQSDCVKKCGDDNWIELSVSTTLNFVYNVRDGHC